LDIYGTATADDDDDDEDEEGGVRWPLQRVHRRFFFSSVSEEAGEGEVMDVGVVGAVLVAIEGRGDVGEVGEDEENVMMLVVLLLLLWMLVDVPPPPAALAAVTDAKPEAILERLY
jgi:hypothetical protein